MKYLLSVCLLLLLFVISNVTSQNSPSNCYYNGLDYSFLNLNGSYYTAYSANSKYQYYWNVCGETKRCFRGIGACQIDLSKSYAGIGNPLYLVGASDESLFSTVGGYSILTYKTSFFPCQIEMYRDFNIRFICGNSSQVSLSNVDEIGCKYYVNMTSSLFCSSSSSSWESSSSSSSSSYYPTSTPSSQQVTCRLTDSGLIINSTHSITCASSGQIQCFTSTDTLISGSPLSDIKYSTTSGSIRCVGNHIECSSINTSCSVDKSNYNGLNVNGIKTGSNYYDSSL